MPRENKTKRKMDMIQASRGVWLVKVPSYVGKLWEKAPSDMQVATMRMEKSTGDKDPAKVKLLLSQELIQLYPDKIIASEHELKLSTTKRSSQITGIFSTIDEPVPESTFEGWITNKMECHPVCNDQYLKMKKQVMQCQQPSRSAETLDNIVKNFKPVSSHVHNREEDRLKKEATLKILSKEVILDLLFQAFEKHQYYSLKDLQFVTKQSPFVLKSVLKDIGIYNKDPAHKQMWELKTEYRHYQAVQNETK